MGSEFMNRISRSKKVKRGFRISDPENLKSINISAIFTAKKAIRGGGSECLHPFFMPYMDF